MWSDKLFYSVHILRDALVVISADGALSQGTGECTTCEWGPRDGADAKVLEKRKN